MRKLSENDYDFHKMNDCWDPIEAASIVCGIDPRYLDYANLPNEIKQIYEHTASLYLDFKFGNINNHVTVEITNTDSIELYKTYTPEFCYEDELYACLNLTCFDPCFYVSMVIENGLVKVSPCLKISKCYGEEGRYCWADEPDWKPDLDKFEHQSNEPLWKDADPLSHAIKHEPFGNDDLPGKEKQELGRLRAEKAAMDASVKAAIKVGQFIQQKTGKGEKLIRKEIEDLIYNIDKHFPNTRINFIWKCISGEFKKGGEAQKSQINNLLILFKVKHSKTFQT